jgi:hypothetical protein
MVTIPLAPLNFHLIDCSSIISFSGADYSNPDRFLDYREDIWEYLEDLIDHDKLKTVPQLWKEIEYNDTNSYKRLNARHDRFTVDPDDDTDSKVLHLLYMYPSLIEAGILHYTREPADPYLIVYAQKWRVPIIADEKRIHERIGKNSNKRLKIPDVCDKENIPCTNIEKYLKKEKIIPSDYTP